MQNLSEMGLDARHNICHNEVLKALIKFLDGDYSKYFTSQEISQFLRLEIKNRGVIGSILRKFSDKKIVDLEYVIPEKYQYKNGKRKHISQLNVYSLNPNVCKILSKNPKIIYTMLVRYT